MTSTTPNQLEQLRQHIDEVDQRLLSVLARRLTLVKQVGQYKHQHQLPALQPDRWQKVLEDRQQKGKQLGLPTELVTEIWEIIHQEALKLEEKVIATQKEQV